MTENLGFNSAEFYSIKNKSEIVQDYLENYHDLLCNRIRAVLLKPDVTTISRLNQRLFKLDF